MADEFNLGDIVKLKSGGPPMTITGIRGDGRNVTCTWFKSSNESAWQVFPKAALDLAKI